MWDRPPELYGRADVDELVKRRPDQADISKKSSPAYDDNEGPDGNESMRMEQDEGNDDDEGNMSDNGEPVKKKSKKEKR